MKRLMRRGIYLMILMVFLSMMSSCRSSKKRHETSEFKNTSVFHVQIPGEAGSLTKEQKLLVDEAYTWLGTPYGYAHSEKGVATDCSGMVLMVYETVMGVKLPRNSAKQAEFCQDIKKGDIKVGDLVFFATGKDPNKISHVGIMLDDDNFIHASSSKGVVVSSISQPYYIRTFIQFGRVPL